MMHAKAPRYDHIAISTRVYVVNTFSQCMQLEAKERMVCISKLRCYNLMRFIRIEVGCPIENICTYLNHLLYTGTVHKSHKL